MSEQAEGLHHQAPKTRLLAQSLGNHFEVTAVPLKDASGALNPQGLYHTLGLCESSERGSCTSQICQSWLKRSSP